MGRVATRPPWIGVNILPLTYFYMEGMNAAMGSFGSYGHRVQAVTVVDRSLKEVAPGVYAGRLRIPVAGHYDVAFLLENPRVLHCFSADAAPNPARPPPPNAAAAAIRRACRMRLIGPAPPGCDLACLSP